MKKQVFIIATLALALVSCSDHYLQREPHGSTMVQSQYEKLSNTLEGSMRGIYAMMYDVTDHDEFGQRSIDLFTDILSGDIALTAYTYGWLYNDEQMQTATYRTGYTWVYYYSMLHNINSVLNVVKNSTELLDTLAAHSGDAAYKYSEETAEMAKFYAQALTMRGYAYSHLAQLYIPNADELRKSSQQTTNFKAFPVYTEDNMDTPQPFATPDAVFKRINDDLADAIEVFELFDGYSEIARDTKLEADINVARGLLAYSKLNQSTYYNGSERTDLLNDAIKAATDVINLSSYSILANSDLLTDGFNDVSSTSWVWGQTVTTETAGGLASFFGQVDIHSYSYAWAGDTKVIDANLKAKIPSWDGRAKWFNDGSKNPTFTDCPDGKFFSAANPYSTSDQDIDREWLSDNVFMRIETMYLIASEAYYYLDDYAMSAQYLNDLTSERLIWDNETKAADATATTEHEAYKATLTDPATLLSAIEYNWRIELWGEGYGLQTFRRMVHPVDGKPETQRSRGSNHLVGKNSSIDPADGNYTFQIPSSETTYNTNI